MRIINRSYKQSIGTTPYRLFHWAPTDMDRGGLLTPFRDEGPLPVAKSTYVQALEVQYENLLDITSTHILSKQAKLAKRYDGVILTDFLIVSFALIKYTVRGLPNYTVNGKVQSR